MKKLQDKSNNLFYAFLFTILLNINKILWVAPSDQELQLQKFPRDTFTMQSQEIAKEAKKPILYHLFKIPLNTYKISGVASSDSQLWVH